MFLQWKSILLGILVVIMLVGCGGGGSSSSGGGNTATNKKTISGYVIDDPVVGATIEAYDENGNLIAKEENATDQNGFFKLDIKQPASTTIRLVALPKKGTPLITYMNLDKNSVIYLTQYTTALVDDVINEGKDPKIEYFKLYKKLNFNDGIPTNSGSYESKKINYIASKIHNSFKNKTIYSIYDDSNLTHLISRSLPAGSMIDFSLAGYTHLTCDNTSLISILDNTKLSISQDLNKTTNINCLAIGKNKFNIYKLSLLPINSPTIDMNATQRNIEISGMQINKPSNDSIQVKNAGDSPVLLKNNSHIISGQTLLDFYPNGKVLKKPLIVKIPSTDQNQSYYLLSKDGSIEKAKSTYTNGAYEVTVPHFTKFIQAINNILTTSTNFVKNKDYNSIKNLLIEKDKSQYTFSDDLSYPTLLTAHGYTKSDLKKNLNIEALLESLLLHNGNGIIDFDGTNINFNGGTLKFGVSSDTALKNNDSQSTTLSEINVLIKLLQLRLGTLKIAEEESYKEDHKQYLQKLGKQKMYKKILNDLYNSSKKNIKDYNIYLKQLNEIESKYQTSKKTYQDIEKALQEYDQLANRHNRDGFTKGYEKFNSSLMALQRQEKLLKDLTGKSLNSINYHRKDFLKILKEEVKEANAAVDTFKKTNNPFKISKKAESLINDLYQSVNNDQAFANKVSSFSKEFKTMQVIEAPKESDIGDSTGKFLGVIGFAFKAWSIASTYDFNQIDNKIEFLNKLKPFLSDDEKDQVNDLINKLVFSKIFNKSYISTAYAYLYNATQSLSNEIDFTNDAYSLLSLSKGITSKIDKFIGEGAAADLGSILSISNTFAQGINTWQGLNSLAYMSTTASTLAYQLSKRATTAKERLDYYCLFQTISASSLTSWYFYSGKKAANIDKTSSSYWLYVGGNLLNVGLSMVSNPTPLGVTDAMFNILENDLAVSGFHSRMHKIDTFSWTFSLEDKQISDILARTAEYKNIVNGIFDTVFSHKRDLIIPIAQISELPDGDRLFSFYIKNNNLDRIAIRFDRKDSNTYIEDIANNTDTEAAETGYIPRIGTYKKYDVHNNEKLQRDGLIVDTKKSMFINVVVGKNVNRLEILGWNKNKTLGDTIPYIHTIDINPTVSIDSSRIYNIKSNLQNQIAFDDPNNPSNLKYLLNNRFIIINLYTGKNITNATTLSNTKSWIALKYYNSQMYSVALIKDNNKLYYFIRDNVFNVNTGDVGGLFGGSIDFAKMFTLKYPISSLKNDIDTASRGAFSAIYSEDLFPNLEAGIKNIESLYNDNPPVINDHSIQTNNLTATLSVQATDPDNDPLTCSVNWGDKKTEKFDCSEKISHTYVNAGDYTILVTATDDKGLSSNTVYMTQIVKSAIPTTSLDVTIKPSTITLLPDETISDKSITLYVTSNADSSTCDVSINGKSIGTIASQAICAVGATGSKILLDSSNEKIGTNTVKVTVKDANDKLYSKSVSFDITKQSPNYTLSFLGENYKDGTTLKMSDGNSISKYWNIKNISNHAAHLILEKDSAKTCNLDLMSTTNNREEFDLSTGKSNKFVQNYKMPTKDGAYTCSYKIKDSKGNYYKVGNASDISIHVKVISNPLFVNTDFDSEIKVGSSATMITQINKGNPPYSYKINWGDGQTTDISNSNVNSTFTHLYNNAGTYTVKVDITDKTGKLYSKTYVLKVSKNISKVTKWSAYVDEVKNTGGNTGDITKNITIQSKTYNKKTVNDYSVPYTKASDDKLYYTGYKLPVPQGLISLNKKVRVTFVTKIDTTTGFWNYDREFWLQTNSKKYGSVIEDAKDGLNNKGVFVAKDLTIGTRTDTDVSDFVDSVVKDKGVSAYALGMDKYAITTYKYTKGGDGNYTYASIHSYPDNTGKYLSQIDLDFKGSGDIILAFLQYDKNGNGKFDPNESLVLNTADGSVNWSKIGKSISKDINQTSTIKKTGQTKSYDTNGNEVTDGSLKDDGYYQKGVTPSYTRDDAKGIVTDNITKLQWQDNEEAKTVTKTWQGAKDYCSALTLGGYTDWRLPTAKELSNIVDYGKSYPAIDTTYFHNFGSYGYWSSTTYEDDKSDAWVVGFYGGGVYGYGKGTNGHVRCVRDGQ